MKMTIDGVTLMAVAGETVLQTAQRAGIKIPTLCHHPAFAGQGRCRMCLVEVERKGRAQVVASCTYPAGEGLTVTTSTPEIEAMRRDIVMLLYKKAPASPLLRELFQQYGCQDADFASDPDEKCILCGLCVQACAELGSGAISLTLRGTEKRVATPFDEASADCIGCGSCARICPTEAIPLRENGDSRQIWHRDFPMAACQRCGALYATQAQLAFFAARDSLGVGPVLLCESCRKKAATEKLRPFAQEGR